MSNREGGSPEQVFGRVMREQRETAQQSQRWLAERMTAMGFSWRQPTVAKVEAGERTVTLNELVAVGDVFEVEMLDLIRGWDSQDRDIRERAREAQERVDRLQEQRDAAAATLAAVEAELTQAVAGLRMATGALKFAERKAARGEV